MRPAFARHVTPPGALLRVACSWALVPATRRAGAPEIVRDGVAAVSDTVAGCFVRGKGESTA